MCPLYQLIRKRKVSEHSKLRRTYAGDKKKHFPLATQKFPRGSDVVYAFLGIRHAMWKICEPIQFEPF